MSYEMAEEKLTVNKGVACCQQLEELIAYANEHPMERLWQLLRNWSGNDFILAGNISNKLGRKEHAVIDGVKVYVTDTFHL